MENRNDDKKIQYFNEKSLIASKKEGRRLDLPCFKQVKRILHFIMRLFNLKLTPSSDAGATLGPDPDPDHWQLISIGKPTSEASAPR